MARILHLSDLHLTPGALSATYGDYKTRSIAPTERLDLRKVLKWTICEWVSKEKDHGKLDAIVVSGDITVGDSPEGWEYLDELLNWFDPVLPDPARIVVVPGNHDIARGSIADPHSQYRHFLKYIRDRGFTTPLLEGIDLIDGTPLPDLSKHCVVDYDQGWGIIPINSSHYCGLKEPIDPIEEIEWEEFISKCKAGPMEAGKVANRLRIQDMARVSLPQLRAISALCRHARSSAKNGEMTLIGVMHHQLLPVGPIEEVKPFESLTNLGHFREVLSANKIDVIMHGHKHSERVLIDHISSRNSIGGNEDHKLIIISSGAAGALEGLGRPLFRLAELSGSCGWPMLRLRSVLAASDGIPVREGTIETIQVWRKSSNPQLARARGELIEGDSLDEVYEKALALFSGQKAGEEIQNLTCRVASGTSKIALPVMYPKSDVNPMAGDGTWLEEIVGWWQKEGFKKLELGGAFNHGTRLYGGRFPRPGGVSSQNQIENIIGILLSDRESSRGIATLVDPYLDEVHDAKKNMPSFCMVHFMLVEQSPGLFLDVVAYFRKQEIKYWWPINYAELSILQGRVMDGLKSGSLRLPLHRGCITTIAARAKAGQNLPNIMVPAADMVLERLGGEFWSMIYALCHPGIPLRQESISKWAEVCASLLPVEEVSLKEFLAPHQCLKELIGVSTPFARHHPEISSLMDIWKEMLNRNLEINKIGNKLTKGDYDMWAKVTRENIDRMKTIIDCPWK